MHGSILGLRKAGYTWCAKGMNRLEEEKRFPEQSPDSSLGADDDHESVVESASPWWVVIGKSFLRI